MFTHKKSVTFLSIGALLVVLGVIFFLCFPVIFNTLLKQQISLKNGTLGYKVWQDIPLPIYQRLYFFNITNADNFLRRREKANLVEVGPYTFKSRWVKEDIVFHPNGTVSFKEVRTFVFLRNESVGSQDDQIVTLNAPLLLAANFLKNYELPIRLAASLAFGIAGERLIVKKSIKQLAFDGYRDIIILLSPILKKDIPFKNGLFAWLYGKNDTDDGLYNVFTGEDTLDNLNIIDRWNGKDSLGFWNGASCNMFNGSNAEIAPPLQPYQNTYTFFQSVFCRSLTLDYTEDVEHLGVTSRRFMTTNMTLANGTQNPINACFDTKMKLPSGAQDISSCQYDAPVVLSFPHFYFGDPMYLKGVNGLHPNASLHDFHIDIEPNTGFSIDAAVRFQVNLYVQRIYGISQLQNVPTVMFPVFWADLSFSLTEDLANVFKNKVYLPKNAAIGSIFGLMGLGVLVCIGTISYMCWVKRDDKKISPPPVFVTR
ncbi:scavenger receptor class B member 1-like isoform X2 [Argiope bruennichi]|uniref:Scavenger receptor class B member 1 n=1 Tax=Argiope bruennichi TaxID=94029 RepID=A0A8T0FM15_ARGBR|nr:scavenger receptor class B member 1-like isoform X2 [Argiope bruennichi]KAF8792247.1 Scavenger receptor class B member 1 like protein [Argiope bruennichi]